MSLFKCREWWSTGCGVSEIFGEKSLSVGRISCKERADVDIIATGSFNGLLRIYLPKTRGYETHHLLCEYDFQKPILQVKFAKYTSDMYKSLLVLGTDDLTVLKPSFSGTSGLIVCSLSVEFEINLPNKAHSFVVGRFGSEQFVASACVLTFSGGLVYLREGKIFNQAGLSDFFLPVSIEYFKSENTILVANCNYEVICLKRVDMNDGGEVSKESNRRGSMWTYDVGSNIVHIHSLDTKSENGDIYVVAENAILLLSRIGKLKTYRKLTSRPLSSFCYSFRDKAFLCLSCEDGQMYIFRSCTLAWKTKTPYIPVSICLVNAPEAEQLLVFLSATGQLSCNYLGTEPVSKRLEFPESRSIDTKHLLASCKEIEKGVIRFLQNESKASGSFDTDEEEMRQCSKVELVCDIEEKAEASEEESFVRICVFVKSLNVRSFAIVSGKVSIEPSMGIKCNQNVLPLLADGAACTKEVEIELSIGCRNLKFVSPPSVTVFAELVSEQGEHVNVFKVVPLPLNMVFRHNTPTKSGKFKLVLKVSVPVSLNSLLFDSKNNPVWR